MGGNHASNSKLVEQPRVLLLHGWISSHQLYRECWAIRSLSDSRVELIPAAAEVIETFEQPAKETKVLTTSANLLFVLEYGTGHNQRY